jgi:ankyrin repeat protein
MERIFKIYKAIEQGNLKRVKRLLRKGLFYKPDINAVDTDKNTALHYAARKGKKEIVELLINQGAQINLQNKDGYTALILASYLGFEEIVELLVGVGAEVELKSYQERTALFCAARKGYKEIVELLIKEGADVNTKDRRDLPVIVAAASFLHFEIVEILIKNGAHKKQLNKKFKFTTDDIKCHTCNKPFTGLKNFDIILGDLARSPNEYTAMKSLFGNDFIFCNKCGNYYCENHISNNVFETFACRECRSAIIWYPNKP